LLRVLQAEASQFCTFYFQAARNQQPEYSLNWLCSQFPDSFASVAKLAANLFGFKPLII
jgi:hypothetical protein